MNEKYLFAGCALFLCCCCCCLFSLSGSSMTFMTNMMDRVFGKQESFTNNGSNDKEKNKEIALSDNERRHVVSSTKLVKRIRKL